MKETEPVKVNVPEFNNRTTMSFVGGNIRISVVVTPPDLANLVGDSNAQKRAQV